jgi:hypothetical protein
MTLSLPSLLESTLSTLSVLVAFRALPFVAHVIFRHDLRIHIRALVAAVFFACAYLGGEEARDVLASTTCGYVYFAACILVIRWLAIGSRRQRAADSLLLFTSVFVLFLGAPALLRHQLPTAAFLVIGWELMLKGYSYASDAPENGTRLRDCLFFMFVDPSLVFPHRAKRASIPADVRNTLVNTLVATLALFVAVGIKPILALEAPTLQSSILGASDFATAVSLGFVSGTALLLTAYVTQSGLASLRIGLIQLCGYQVGECYNWPLLSRSPAEFWTRWNIYMGQWARRYLFTPLSLGFARGASRQTARYGSVAAAIAAFVGVGALHDLFRALAGESPSVRATAFFLANALLLLAWPKLAAIPSVRKQSLGWSDLVNRSAFLAALIGLVAIWSAHQ